MTEKRLPPSFQVGPLRFRLLKTLEADASHRFGEVNFVTQTVNLGLLCQPQRLPETLMHELIHVVATQYDLTISHEDIARLSMGLTQALQSLGVMPDELKLETEP